MIALMMAVALAATPDSPHVWGKQLVGVGGWPTGAISDTRIQYRVPGKRSDGIVFQNTYAGVGGRLQVSPAFVDIGPRLSWAPIDVFDLDLQGSWTGYAGPFGPLPMDGLDGKIESARNLRNGEEIAVSKFEIAATPTFKAQVGPVVAFNTTQVSVLSATMREDTELWYEPYRDLVVATTDVTIENQAAVLVEAMDGEGKPKLLFGPQVRHRQAFVSKDRYTNLGALVAFKPGTKTGIPTLVGQGGFYLQDRERVGTVPNLQLAATWTLDRVLR